MNKNVKLEYLDIKKHVNEEEFNVQLRNNKKYLEAACKPNSAYQDSLGWIDIDEWANDEAILNILEKAREIREHADVFVLVGVGGSNQGARAVIKALQSEGTPEILYAGNNISAHYMNQLLKKLENKSVYINVIAKNFETLEPGISFRVLRKYLYQKYGQEANKRITVTGTKGSKLEQIAIDKGFNFLTFPDNIGGRYSIISDVGLFPMAVAGVDIKALIEGAKEMKKRLFSEAFTDNIALKYATYRNLLLSKGFDLEMLGYFEPQFDYFAKWWIQLFAESEGKEHKGIFPIGVSFSEDLHSVGQYIQEGQKILFETFLDIDQQNSSIVLEKDHVEDQFDYLNGKDFWGINKVAFEATINAHTESGIPCIKFSIPKMDEFYFGQLFYLFEFSCYLSGSILGINPFDQPGVENYKGYMFKLLGKGRT